MRYSHQGDTSKRWNEYFLRQALLASTMSKDPSTKVGAVIVDYEGIVLATGFNGFPRGIVDSPGRLADRDTKLRYMVHGEMNAVLSAARNGVKLYGSTMYIAAQGKDGVWGGPPCVRCAVECIQAGVKHIISFPFKTVPSRWAEDLAIARNILEEAGVSFDEHPLFEEMMPLKGSE
jgi:dCMP deaminase